MIPFIYYIDAVANVGFNHVPTEITAIDRTMLAIKHTKYMNFPFEYCILFMNTLILDLYITFKMMSFY